MSRSRIGLALSTVGRPTLTELLDSLAASRLLPREVAVADHTPGRDLRVEGNYPFAVHVVPSTGGVSRGRNDALAALGPECDVVGFPNDDNLYPAWTLTQVQAAFDARDAPAALGGTLLEQGVARFRLPRPGTPLDRRSVWRAIEPALFLRRSAFEAVGGFRDDMGAGSTSPWQSGDGTDVLLSVLAAGGVVLSRPDIAVLGRGERKGLSDDAFVAKHRAYARGTGYVYRHHGYPLSDRLRIVVGPLLKATRHDPALRLSLRLSLARTAGRVEGLLGRPLPGGPPATWD